MTFTVGGTDVSAVYLGATPVDAVYLGDEKVWPAALLAGQYRFTLVGTGVAAGESHPQTGQMSVGVASNVYVIRFNPTALGGKPLPFADLSTAAGFTLTAPDGQSWSWNQIAWIQDTDRYYTRDAAPAASLHEIAAYGDGQVFMLTLTP